jgi:hypothetical protein
MRLRARRVSLTLVALTALAWASSRLLRAQTTQGLISGQVADSVTGRPVAGALVRYEQTQLSLGGAARTDRFGYFALPLLSPGGYKLRIEAAGYQPLQMEEVTLAVAGRLDFPLRLRPLHDVWESGQYRSVFLPDSATVLDFYGPDLDASRAASFEPPRGVAARLETGLSQVITAAELRDLPLIGRDAYTLLVTQPGVTTDTATGRGLGLAINGQRPSASNFLLDGLEHNNYLTTGPLSPVAPEAVGEYRVSTNNFSAEYGRAAGFVANAASRAGGNAWHGLGYFYLRNDALNANGFAQNAAGVSRRPLKETQPGFSFGGPLRRERLFASAAFEHLRLRAEGDPVRFRLPTSRFVQEYTAPGSVARRLLERFGAASDPQVLAVEREQAPTASLNRYLALPRVDWVSAQANHRVLTRLALVRRTQPDFSWSPYRDFRMALEQTSSGLGGAWTAALGPTVTSELRAGWSRDHLAFDRPAQLVDGVRTPLLSLSPRVLNRDASPPPDSLPILLPGGAGLPDVPVFYGYSNRARNWEIIENVALARGRHAAKFGGGWLDRAIEGFASFGRDASFQFRSLEDFGRDAPASLFTGVSRPDLPAFRKPDDHRRFHYRHFFLFAQDSFRVTGRLTLNLGARYDRFGAPRSTGPARDPLLELGNGADLPARLAGAGFQPGRDRLYGQDGNDAAARVGLSYRAGSRTVARAAWGIFYDRPFDNLWFSLRANSVAVPLFELASFFDPAQPRNYLTDPLNLLAGFDGRQANTSAPAPVLFQPGLRSPYAQSAYAGLTHQLSGDWTAEVSYLGSLGRKLITSDLVNRIFSLSAEPFDPANPARVFNPALPEFIYRGNQGSSSYHAMAVTTRYRGPRVLGNVSYTWGKWIDNQSEALNGDATNLSFSGRGGAGAGVSAFARQFDSGGDRGPSDFDQRHNLVFYSVWTLPEARGSGRWAALARGWQLAQLAGFRSGFPFTVYATGFAAVSLDEGRLYNNRANLNAPDGYAIREAAPGGWTLLRRDAFADPPAGVLGGTGRNAFRGPGMYNLDLSLSRSVRLPWLGEAGRIVLRADAFNVLNHANLNNPESRLDAERPLLPNFGEAALGRRGRRTAFPALSPLDETARQLQVLLRFEF